MVAQKQVYPLDVCRLQMAVHKGSKGMTKFRKSIYWSVVGMVVRTWYVDGVGKSKLRCLSDAR